jgi:hypothetical protein
MAEFDMEGAVEALAGDLPDSYSEASESGEEFVEDNPVEESFTGFDPASLPEDLQQVYRSMQADYTRKTQEVAELRRYNDSLSELGVNPDEAVNIVDFFRQLENDPQIANEFVSRVQSYWEQPNNTDSFGEDYAPVEQSYEGLPPALAHELEEMRQFRHEMMMQQQQAEIMGELEMEEQQIRMANPHYTDDDVEAIYSLAYATEGDLQAAANQYHAIQQRLLGGYLQSKQVPQGATPIPSGPNTVPAQGFKNLDEAHKAAMEALRNIS